MKPNLDGDVPDCIFDALKGDFSGERAWLFVRCWDCMFEDLGERTSRVVFSALVVVEEEWIVRFPGDGTVLVGAFVVIVEGFARLDARRWAGSVFVFCVVVFSWFVDVSMASLVGVSIASVLESYSLQ